MSNLIKEGYFNLSTMLNLKSIWMYRTKTSKPEHTNMNKGNMNFKDQAMEINMSKGLVNLTFAYLSILTDNM